MNRVRSRCYLVTIMNYTDEDCEDWMAVLFKYNPKYAICGFEVCPTTGTPHMQTFIQFRNQIDCSSLKAMLPTANIKKADDQDSDRFSPFNMMMYCKGYESCPLGGIGNGPDDCSSSSHHPVHTHLHMKSGKENEYYSWGDEPILPGQAGGNAKAGNSTKVMNAIKEGKSYAELEELFPSFMMYHGDKVRKWLSDHKKVKTNFFWYEADKTHGKKDDQIYDEVISECVSRFGDDGLAVVTDLTELEAYPEYKTVLYLPDDYDRKMLLWPKGVPITYKLGYRIVTVKPENFVISGIVWPSPLYMRIREVDDV